MSKDFYAIGECKRCKNITVLKNGLCMKCNKVREQIDSPEGFLPKEFEDLFGNFGSEHL